MKNQISGSKRNSFIEYLIALDEALAEHGLTWQDVNLSFIITCHGRGETSEECAARIGSTLALAT